MEHEELVWMPMCTPPKGKPWFFTSIAGDRRRETVKAFEKHCQMEWKALRIEGWSIVRVRLTTAIHQ